LAAGVADAVTVGLVLSMLTTTEVEAELPALSTAVPMTDWFAPSVESVVEVEQDWMPESASMQVYVTVTFSLFQPLALAAGAVTATIVGLVLSTLTLAVAVAAFPATSTAVPKTSWLAPSVETMTDAGQVVTPESPSEQWNVTVTSPLFQPLAFAARLTLAVMDGVVVSVLSVADVVAVLPAAATAVPVTTWFCP
jgi:hypothetical protein